MTGHLIGNACNGVGDAVMYCHVIHSLRAAGLPHLLSAERHLDVLSMLSVPPEWTFTGARTPIGKCPPKGVPGSVGWLRRWVDDYSGTPGIPFTAPTYTEAIADGRWADSFWEGRGPGPRVLIFPHAVWSTRQWTDDHWSLVAHALKDQGIVPVVVTPSYDPGHTFPYAVGGLTLRQCWALTRRANVVACVNSGPALWAPTLGIPTVVVHGATSTEWVHDHFQPRLVHHVSTPRGSLACSGCDWLPDRGWTGRCRTCAAILMINPTTVARAILERVSKEPRPWSLSLPLLSTG